ncbi:MAG: T9SS type A sorting domain-containing protein, partial [Bacteroidia bacterium]|nr:T9SS type A sorting domain-containing protein [Bacteroidia bacterium]
TYTWSSAANLLIGSSVVVSPNASTTYTIMGTDNNGCTGNTTFALAVNACVGLNEISTANGVKVSPNPSNGMFAIEFSNDADKTVEVCDVTGRIVASSNSTDKKVNINISNLANGIYYVKIQSNKNVEVVKIIKD